MASREEARGHWNEVKGRLKEHWGQLTDDDLRRAEGSTDRLVGVVQQKTGATKSEIEKFIDNVLSGSIGDQAAQAMQHYAEAAQDAASEAASYARENYRRVASQTGDYGAKVADSVRSRPAESLAIAFGLGIAAGALFFLGNRK